MIWGCAMSLDLPALVRSELVSFFAFVLYVSEGGAE